MAHDGSAPPSEAQCPPGASRPAALQATADAAGAKRARRRETGSRPAGRRPAEGPLDFRPLVSIITPVFDIDPEWLSRAVESVRRQTYPHWQLCLADDGSTNERTLEYLRTLADEPGIHVSFGDDNRGIAAASNRALEAAEGEFVAFLDHDDELAPDALSNAFSS